MEKKITEELPSKYILINRSATLDDSIGRYTEPAPGKVFLVLDMEIENHGYPEFSVNTLYFSIVMDGVEYSYDSATYILKDDGKAALDTVKLRDGGKTSGSLVFEIPKGKTQYTIEYTGLGNYEFIFGKIPEPESEPESEPEPVVSIRDVIFDLSKVSSESIVSADESNTKIDTSSPGLIIQTTYFDGVLADEPDFAKIRVKTYQVPINEQNALASALEEAKDMISKYVEIFDEGTYMVTLASGEETEVHAFGVGQSNVLYEKRADVCIFMPDDSTIVIALSSMWPKATNQLFETLEIGENPYTQTDEN